MITFKQRKNCGSCKAFSPGGRKSGAAKCTLGYSIEQKKLFSGIIIEGAPTEPCPKPLTTIDHIESIKNYIKKNTEK